jgi:uncharacterized protein (TIGR00156 family)
MQKLLYTLPIALVLGVGTAGAQYSSDSEGGQRNRPENVKPENPTSNTHPAAEASNPLQRQDSRAAAKNAAPVTTAQGVSSAQNKQRVQLRGKIVSQQGRNQYMFSDNSGNVVVDIPNKLLNGQKLAAGTEVEIQGDVDTRIRKSPKVEAKSVMVLAAAGGSGSRSAPMKMDQPPPGRQQPKDQG